MAVGVKKIPRPDLNVMEKWYLVEVVKGMAVTMGHMASNFFMQTLLGKRLPRTVNELYPEEPLNLPPGYRGEHRLMLREDNKIRCTACMLCATACPARCIKIVAAEDPDTNIEKYPSVYTIDLLRCVFCGYCVEACPCDAIRMDTGKFENASFTRGGAVVDLVYLTHNHGAKSPTSEGIY
jgi:NADH-quinone oxidoreductase subunit I